MNNNVTDKKLQLLGQHGFTEELLNKISHEYPKLHSLIERGLIVNHKDFDQILNCKTNGNDMYIYTGRGPSSGSLHFGHFLPFYITKELQDVFDAKVVIQVTDDEKYLYSSDKTMKIENFKEMALENIKDIIAFGFDMKKTFIFTNTEFIGNLYEVDLEIKKHFTLNQIKNTFGVGDSDNVGRISYPTLQMVPCVPKVFEGFINKNARCLIPCADDQDVYFRLARDILLKMKVHKPSMLFVGYVPSLQTVTEKMSSSKPETAIYLNDSNKTIQKKIGRAFSGGKETIEEHREKGGDCDVDVSLNILKYFIGCDDYKDIRTKYKSGELTSSELKKKTIDTLATVKDEFIERRTNLTEETVLKFMSLNKI